MEQRSRRDAQPELEERVVWFNPVSKVVKGGRTGASLRWWSWATAWPRGSRPGEVPGGCRRDSQSRGGRPQEFDRRAHRRDDDPAREITTRFSGAKVFLKPASPGTGVIAGGPVRAVRTGRREGRADQVARVQQPDQRRTGDAESAEGDAQGRGASRHARQDRRGDRRIGGTGDGRAVEDRPGRRARSVVSRTKRTRFSRWDCGVSTPLVHDDTPTIRGMVFRSAPSGRSGGNMR